MAENNQMQESPESNVNGSKKGNTSKRGFASMSREQQREIASKGGQAAHQQGVAHEWTSEEARVAGRKGGQASRSKDHNVPETGPQDVNNSAGEDDWNEIL